MRYIVLKLLYLYQKFFTLLGYGSCRYYPSCSEYTKQQFIYNNFLSATYYATKRILSCNQLFAGGIDYPVVPKPATLCCKRIDVVFWLIPLKENPQRCYLVKSF